MTEEREWSELDAPAALAELTPRELWVVEIEDIPVAEAADLVVDPLAPVVVPEALVPLAAVEPPAPDALAPTEVLTQLRERRRTSVIRAMPNASLAKPRSVSPHSPGIRA